MLVRPVVVVAVILALLSPAALAAWSIKGAAEPDTLRDVTDLRMQLEPDTSPSGSVLYFNGFGSAGGLVSTTLNPNVATARSSFHATPFLPVAMLGVWKDCNGDGYVGAADQGLLEYPSSALLDDSVCPAAAPPPQAPWSVHNDGSWVVELMPIGYDDVTTPGDSNPLTINDTSARVWADWGLPGDAPMLTCLILPAPHGTFRSTGGLLRWADCFSGHRVVPTASDAFEAAGAPDLSFNDAAPDRPDQSRSLLNQPNPWGSEADEPAVVVFDCASSSELFVDDPTGGSLRNLATVPVPGGPVVYVNGTDSEGRVFNATVPGVAPDVPGGGSPAGSVNDTQAALTDCDRSDEGEIVDMDGHVDGSDADLPYFLEGHGESISPYARRTRTDHVLAFEEGARGGGPFAAALGSRTRDDAGSGALATMGFWVGLRKSELGPNPYVGRAELAAAPVTTITYYAYVSPSLVQGLSLVLPQPGTAPYGAEACARPVPTFECDEDAWWRNAAGQDVTPRDGALGEDPDEPSQPEQSDFTKIGVRVWQPYHMRDIDCVDSSVSPAREAGLHWGALTQTACERA